MEKTFQYSDELQIMHELMKSSMREADPDRSIENFLEAIGTHVNADRVALFEEVEREELKRTYEWAASPEKALSEAFRYLHLSSYPVSWQKAYRGKETLVVRDADSYKDTDAEFYRSLLASGIRNVVVCPVLLEKGSYGFAEFVNSDMGLVGNDVNMYNIAADFLAVLLRYKRNVDTIYRTHRENLLTGANNMPYFYLAADPLIEMVRQGKSDTVWAIVSFDLADFKVFNSEYGNYEGDRALIAMSGIIRDCLGTDRFARFEADHFCAVVPDREAEELVVRVHDRMLKEQGHLLVRAGIYTITGEEKNAAQACDRAMVAGDAARGDLSAYFRRYDAAMSERISRENYLLSHLDQAIEEGWIQVYYQPIVGLFCDRIASFEALARWNDPVLGFLAPAEFIDVFERNKLIYKLDLAVIEQVCRKFSECRSMGIESRVSVNLSRNDLEIPGIHERISSILAKYDVDPERITIEITESSLAGHENLISDHIRAFHEEGHHVWLDDFGSGYSSFNAIQNFDFDLMKIDMTFLRNENEKTPDVLRGIITLAKQLGLNTLIEGVETEEQYGFMKQIGCALAQGYYISKPVPGDRPLSDLLSIWKRDLETDLDYRFFKYIDRVNVVTDAESGTRGEIAPIMEAPMLTIVAQHEDGSLETLFTNANGRKWMEEVGLRDFSDATEFNNHSTDPFAVLFREQVAALQGIGQTTDFDVDMAIFRGRMRTQLIANVGGRKGFLITCIRREQGL